MILDPIFPHLSFLIYLFGIFWSFINFVLFRTRCWNALLTTFLSLFSGCHSSSSPLSTFILVKFIFRLRGFLVLHKYYIFPLLFCDKIFKNPFQPFLYGRQFPVILLWLLFGGNLRHTSSNFGGNLALPSCYRDAFYAHLNSFWIIISAPWTHPRGPVAARSQALSWPHAGKPSLMPSLPLGFSYIKLQKKNFRNLVTNFQFCLGLLLSDIKN